MQNINKSSLLEFAEGWNKAFDYSPLANAAIWFLFKDIEYASIVVYVAAFFCYIDVTVERFFFTIDWHQQLKCFLLNS